jgi:hypothetical protein
LEFKLNLKRERRKYKKEKEKENQNPVWAVRHLSGPSVKAILVAHTLSSTARAAAW